MAGTPDLSGATPNQNPQAAPITQLDSFIVEDFGPQASALFLAQAPTELEVNTIYAAVTQIKAQYENKPDEFYPTPAQLLLFSREYTPAELNQGAIEDIIDVTGEIFRQYKIHCKATDQERPSYAQALEYAVQMQATGTLDRFNEGELYSAEPLQRLQHVFTLQERIEPGSLLDVEPAQAPVAAPAEAAVEVSVETSNALSLISLVPKADLRVLPISEHQLAGFVAKHGLGESDVHDLIHLQKSDLNALTAIKLLDAGHSMDTVRMVADLQTLLEGTYGDLHLPEIEKQNTRLDRDSMRMLVRTASTIDIATVVKFSEHFDFTDGEEIGAALSEIATELKPFLHQKAGEVSLATLVGRVLKFSDKQRDGVRGYWNEVKDLITADADEAPDSED